MDADATFHSAENADDTSDFSFHPHWALASPAPLPRSAPSSEHRGVLASSRADSAGFVVLSRFTVARMTDEVKAAFQQRPHRVDDAAGFVRMEVLSPLDAPNEIWLFTYWKDEPSYRTWHQSHLFKESHQGIPKGTKLVHKSVSIRFFEHVAS